MTQDFPQTTEERLKLLDNVRVVLVSTKFPGNIGMTARSMKNCGFSDLRLVAPRAELSKEAYQLAPSGEDVLDRVRFHEDLMDAVHECGLVVGTTRRKGVLRKNMLSPEKMADMARAALPANKLALVFGSEDNGLSTEQLSLCHWIVGIHTGSGAESFNLSHSAALVMYVLNRAVVAFDPPPRKLASALDQENMFVDIQRFLQETGFLHERDPGRMMVAMRSILHRAGLSEREARIIRGILRQARWRIQNPEAEIIPKDTPQWIKRQIFEKRKENDDETR